MKMTKNRLVRLIKGGLRHKYPPFIPELIDGEYKNNRSEHMNKYVVMYNRNKNLLDDYQVIEGKNPKDALKRAFSLNYERLTGEQSKYASIILVKGDFRNNTMYYEGRHQQLCYTVCREVMS